MDYFKNKKPQTLGIKVFAVIFGGEGGIRTHFSFNLPPFFRIF